MPTELACFALLPYSNRIAWGRFEIAGELYRLPRNCAGFEHPLHGIGWIRPWDVLERSSDRCTLRLVHVGDADWPFAFTAVHDIRLTQSGLELRLQLTNNGRESMPYGFGQHPYIRRPPGTRIFARVAGVWLSDPERLPTHRVPLPSHWNLPLGCVLDDCVVDHCFDGLQGDVRVEWPDGSGLRVSSAPALPFLVLCSTPGSDSICVEAVSQRPNAFNAPVGQRRDAGVEMLEPHGSTMLVQRFDYLPSADVAH